MAGAAKGVDIFPISADKTKLDVTFSIPTTMFTSSMADNGEYYIFVISTLVYMVIACFIFFQTISMIHKIQNNNHMKTKSRKEK